VSTSIGHGTYDGAGAEPGRVQVALSTASVFPERVPDALRAALQAVGFVDIARLPVENPAPSLFAAGWLIASRVDAATADAPAPPPDIIAAGLDAKRRFSGVSDEAEVFTMIGFRPRDV